MARIYIDIEVWCSCGEGLCRQSTMVEEGYDLIVEPCKKCPPRQSVGTEEELKWLDDLAKGKRGMHEKYSQDMVNQIRKKLSPESKE